mgnify:CR=1 FL=1
MKNRSASMEEVKLEGIKAKLEIGKRIIQRSISITDLDSISTFHAKEVVEDFICNLKEREHPRIITKEFFNCQAKEKIHYYSENVRCLVSHKSSSETYWGTLVITNQRVVYSSPQHKQTYKINLIRDFQVVDFRRSILIVTSERRQEMYSLEDLNSMLS